MKSIEVNKDGPIAEVILLGPGKGNAMGPDFWREVPEAFREIDRHPEVRAVIVRGSGSCFTYGLDLVGMMQDIGPHLSGEQLAAQRTRLFDLIREYQEAFDAVEACRKPVIAAVHGWCVGGGVDMIAACDIRLAAADARFSVREVKLAIVADLGSLQRLPPIIGQGHTRELALTGKDIDAARAERIGLVSHVYGSADELFGAARAMAREIADNPPLTVQGIKRVMAFGEGKPVAEGLAYVAAWNSAFLQSNDLMEAVQAFAEKRPPKFRGE